MIPIIQKRKIWYALSGIFVVGAVIIVVFWGLKLGMDFTGGTLLEVTFLEERPPVELVREKISSLGWGSVSVQPSGDKDMIVRLRNITEQEHQQIIGILQESFFETVQKDGAAEPDKQVVEEKRFETVGPAIGAELKQKAVVALALAIIFIIAYIAYAFRKVSRPVASWKFGVTAIVALVHDTLFVIGVFAILGHVAGVEVDVLFVTALLTILGFSVHDTIVVFDRTRENLFHAKRDSSFEDIVNKSVNQTIWRSVNTSFSTLLVLFAIYFFGGESIKYFTLALILGIFIGTYSSIFLASPLLVDWYKMGLKKGGGEK